MMHVVHCTQMYLKMSLVPSYVFKDRTATMHDSNKQMLKLIAIDDAVAIIDRCLRPRVPHQLMTRLQNFVF